jgi:S1-C subfamily serine protease
MLRDLRAGLLALFLGCLCLGVAMAGPGRAQSPDPGLGLREAERGVVRVLVLHLGQDDQPISMVGGTGFVVAPGKVVTNYHVIQPPEGTTRSLYYVVPDKFAGDSGKDATVLQSWPEADLAILNAPEIAAPALNVTAVAPGKEATVRALGYPGVTDRMRNLPLAKVLEPSEPYVTSGSIALFSDTAPGGGQFDTIFHTAAIDHGNSGGPLLDECDRVIGVNTWGASDTLADDGSVESHQGQFAAIRSTVLAKFLDQAGVKTTVDYSPCVKAPPVDPALVEQVNRANAAAAAALVAAKKAEDERDQTLRWGVILLGLIAAVGAIVLFVRGRQTAPKAFPVAALILALVAVGAAVAWWLMAHPKPAAPPAAPASTAVGLTCRLASGQSFNTPTGAGSLDLSIEPSTGCVNGRTAYEKTAGGFARVTLSDTAHTASQLELSSDMKTFTRRDFTLNDSDYAAFTAGRKSVGPIVCPASGDAASAAHTADGLAKMRALSTSYLNAEPTRVMTWRCSPKPAPAAS